MILWGGMVPRREGPLQQGGFLLTLHLGIFPEQSEALKEQQGLPVFHPWMMPLKIQQHRCPLLEQVLHPVAFLAWGR